MQWKLRQSVAVRYTGEPKPHQIGQIWQWLFNILLPVEPGQYVNIISLEEIWD